MPPVPAPYQERVVEDTAVHADGPVYIVPGEGGGAYDHAVGDVVVPAFLRYLRRQPQIVPVERRRSSDQGMSQELTSPRLSATIVFTAMESYCISFRPTGSI